jgi:hypothetical protein
MNSSVNSHLNLLSEKLITLENSVVDNNNTSNSSNIDNKIKKELNDLKETVF